MQQSDQLLITSLKDFIAIPENVQTLSDIKGDQMFFITISTLQSLGIDVKDIRQIQKQKFRSTTKLNQRIHKQLQIQLELNDLLNPTPSFARKALLSFLSKLDSNQNANERNTLTKEDEQNVQKRRKKKHLLNWLEDQWIHPQLILQSRPSYSAYLFPLVINRKSIKTNVLSQLCRPSTKSNVLSILVSSMNHNLMKQKQSQENTGITRKRVQDSNFQTSKLLSSNFQDWNMTDQKLKKLKRKIQKDKQSTQASKRAQQRQKMRQQASKKEEQVQSVFLNQVQSKIQQKQKQKQIVRQSKVSIPTTQQSYHQLVSDNPLQRVRLQAQVKRNQYQRLIQQLMIQFNDKKQEILLVQERKLKIQAQIQKDEQKLVECKVRTEGLKKQVQKKQLVLTAVESPNQIQHQIKKYEQDIKTMEEQVKHQLQTTTQNTQAIRVQSQKKLQALRDLKIKLNRIQTEYRDVCEEIQDKNQRKGRIKINKSGISRTYYSKKISEIEKRWRETQKEVGKIRRDLEQMREKTRIITDVSDGLEKDVLNLINADKSSKTEQQTKALKQIFGKCQTCFKNTLQTLHKINDVKQETRQYEVKVHALTSQNYKQGIQKVNNALIELKRQIQQMAKKQGQK